MQKEQGRAASVTVFVLCAAAMLAGVWCDLPLNAAVYSPGFAPAVLVEVFCWWAMYVPAILWFALTMLRRPLPFLARAACAMVTYLGFFVVLFTTDDYLLKRGWTAQQNFTACAVAALGGTVLVRLLLARVTAPMQKKLRFVFGFALAYMAADAVVINLLKLIWNRARYDEMLASPAGFSRFTAWYQPMGGGGTSFPSGHTAAACGILVLTLFCLLLPKWQRRRRWVWAACWVFIVFCGAMRVVIGRHFLSDIAAAVAVKYALFLLLTHTKLFARRLNEARSA